MERDHPTREQLPIELLSLATVQALGESESKSEIDFVAMNDRSLSRALHNLRLARIASEPALLSNIVAFFRRPFVCC